MPGLRVVYTYHILTQNSLAQRVCNRLLSRQQDAVVANCTAGARQLVANGIPQDQIHLIYNAVDPTQWQDPATTLRQEIGAEAGGLCPPLRRPAGGGKGHAFLLESLAQLRENTAHPFRLVLAGRAPCARIWKPRPRPWAWPTGDLPGVPVGHVQPLPRGGPYPLPL